VRVKPTKDAVKDVEKLLTTAYKLSIKRTIRSGRKVPGHLTVEPSGTVIHVKGIQKASQTSSNAYYVKSFSDLRKGLTHFLVLVYKDVTNSFVLPAKVVEEIFGPVSPATKGKPRYVYHMDIREGAHFIKPDAKGGKWKNLEAYRNKWDLLPDIAAGSIPVPSPTTPTSASLDSLAADTLLDMSRLLKINSILSDRRQVIFAGPPGTSKTYIAEKFATYFTGNNDNVKLIQFHPSWSYEDFIEGIRPELKDDSKGSRGVKTGQVAFAKKPGVLKRFIKQCEETKDPNSKFVLIIDEINRGDLPRIFGELIYALDYRGKRIAPLYSDEKESSNFSLPENLYIIATMNSQDRSIAFLDYAIQRRLPRITFEPDATLLREWLNKHPPKEGLTPDLIANTFVKINTIIRNTPHLGDDYRIGHAYFMRESLDRSKISNIIEFELKPLLAQYFNESRDKKVFEELGKIYDTLLKTEENVAGGLPSSTVESASPVNATEVTSPPIVTEHPKDNKLVSKEENEEL
jgi:MoxR-like ATPase